MMRPLPLIYEGFFIMEVWKTITDYEDYQVSNLGNVKSLKRYKGTSERILKTTSNSTGYPQVTISNSKGVKNIRVHKLVAYMFMGHKPSGLKIVIDHIDNNPLNNKLSNLQLITNRKNASKDRVGGTSNYVGVSWCNTKNKFRSRIYVNGKTKSLGYFTDEIEAHKRYEYELSLITNK